MGFEEFQIKLRNQMQQPLPGIEAQLKLAPYARVTRKKARELNTSPRLSAILALLFPKNNEPHILLTLRNAYKGVHSRQVSFPGGKYEKSDKNFEETALRETEEEVGIEQSNIKIIGKLTEVYIPPSKFLVHPYVGVLEKLPTYKLDPIEVATIIECSISQLLDDNNVKEKEIVIETTKQKIKTPYFDVNGHIVWGATAMMLSELKEIIKQITELKV